MGDNDSAMELAKYCLKFAGYKKLKHQVCLDLNIFIYIPICKGDDFWKRHVQSFSEIKRQ